MTYQYDYQTQFDCGGFIAQLPVHGEGHATIFSDADGNLVRVQEEDMETGVISNPLTSRSLTYSAIFISTYDALQNTVFIRGQVTFKLTIPYHLTITDGGTAYIDANGNWTFGSAHPHLAPPRICEALAAP